MRKTVKLFSTILALSLLPPLMIWLPFFFRLKKVWGIPIPQDGMATIVSNYDGPLYIVVAKSLYSIEAIKNNFSFDLPVEYYAAHFPLFPLTIKLFSIFTVYPYAMLIATLVSSLVALYFFHKLISDYVSPNSALWLTVVFSIFPARWLIVRSVGSPEPLFIGAIIASVYYFKHKRYWSAAFWGSIAQLTKSPGILLFIAYAALITLPKINKLAIVNVNKWKKIINYRSFPVLSIPLSLLGVFMLYHYTFNDFFAYFHSGDNIHLLFPPFQVFNYSAPWVNTHWLEEIIIFYLIALLGLFRLLKSKDYIPASFVSVFLFSIFFVSHRDILRYSLPIIPFLYVAFADTLTKKEFKFALAIIIIPIYLFALAFISGNAMPVSDWSPLL